MTSEKTYCVIYLNPAKKTIKKEKDHRLKRLYQKVIEKVRKDPYYAGEPKGGDLAGIFCADFDYQGSHYELAYRMKEDAYGDYVVIIMIGTRETFYKDLKNYLYR